MEFSPPSMMVRRDIVGPRLASWNDFLPRLASVHLTQGPYEFRWNLNEVNSRSTPCIRLWSNPLSRYLIISLFKRWKYLIQKFLHGIFIEGSSLLRITLLRSKMCIFCHQEEIIKHLLFRCRFAKSIWSIIQIDSTLYPPRSVTNIFGNWLNGVDHRFYQGGSNCSYLVALAM
jgi:hypothetical protein